MVGVLAALLLAAAGANDEELKPYERALPFKPKFFEPVDKDAATEHIEAAKAAGEKPPNYFKVNEDLQMLPEVFSKLNPDDVKMDHATDGNAAEEAKARDTRWWGRLYIHGWPQTIQYLRAHFGEAPPLGDHTLVLAEPANACDPHFANAERLAALGGKAIVLAERGNCTFGTKAKHALANGAAALVLINNEPGNSHVPGPDAHDIGLSVSMITQDEGALLTKVLRENEGDGTPLVGAMVPIHCSSTSKKVKELCRPATSGERELVETVVVGGTLAIDGDTKTAPGDRHEFLLSTFGTTPRASGYEVAVASPLQACQELRNGDAVAGKAVLVYRGNCRFIDKVEHAHAAGAAMIIVVNHDHALSRFGVEPRWRGLKIDVPTLMVTPLAGDVLSEAAAEGRTVTFAFDGAVDPAIWTKIEGLRDSTGWIAGPKDGWDEVNAEYQRHLKRNAGWPDRVAAIEEGFEKATDGLTPGKGAAGEL